MMTGVLVLECAFRELQPLSQNQTMGRVTMHQHSFVPEVPVKTLTFGSSSPGSFPLRKLAQHQHMSLLNQEISK